MVIGVIGERRASKAVSLPDIKYISHSSTITQNQQSTRSNKISYLCITLNKVDGLTGTVICRVEDWSYGLGTGGGVSRVGG